ncbi:3451_t:CDS:1, partial [Cetraspora pellucida]
KENMNFKQTNLIQQTLNLAINKNKSRKFIINDLVLAFANANIPLENVDKLLL